jgi:hypothetical protein
VIDWDDSDWGVGANIGGGFPLQGCLSEVYLSNTYYDLSNSANRDIFYDSTNHKAAQDLTAISSPFIYLKSAFGSFTTNSGSAGNFTKYGTTAFTSCTAP